MVGAAPCFIYQTRQTRGSAPTQFAMKKTYLIIFLLSIYTFCFSQSVNQQFPLGKYKLAGQLLECNLHIFDNNQLVFQFVETRPDDSGSESEKVQTIIKGTYSEDANSFALNMDSIPEEYVVEAGKSKDVKKGKIRIQTDNFFRIDDDKLLIDKHFIPEGKFITMPDFYKEKSGYEKNAFITNKSDSLFIITSSQLNPDVYAYALPSDVNDIIIHKYRTYKMPESFRMKKGENNNELVLYSLSEDEKFRLNLYYMGNEVDSSLVNFDNQYLYSEALNPTIRHKAFSNNQINSNKTDSASDKILVDTIVAPQKPTSPPAPPVISVDGPVYTSEYNIALDATQYGERFLVLVYNPNGEYNYMNPFELAVTSGDYNENLTKRFVMFHIEPDNIKVLKKFNINRAPAIIILTPNERIIFSSQGKDIYEVMRSTFGDSVQYPERLYEALEKR